MARDDELRSLRAEIDRVDEDLVRLFNQRAAVAIEVARVKRARGLPLEDPRREARVVEQAVAANQGPLPDEAIHRIFRVIIAATLAIENTTEPPERG